MGWWCLQICVLVILALGILGNPLPKTLLDSDYICRPTDLSGTRSGVESSLRTSRDDSDNEEAGKLWLERYNELFSVKLCESTLADWNYNTNLTDANRDISVEYSARLAAFATEAYDGAMTFNWQNFSEPVRRHFSKVVNIGTASLDKEKFQRLTEVMVELEGIYSTAKVCNKPGDSSGRCYPLDPDLSQIMAFSRDWDELVWAWKGWREASGNKMPDLFTDMNDLQNDAAEINGFADGGDYWRSSYETADFEQLCATLWEETKPLYEQLHAYARRKLREQYSNNTFPASGHIPAHLLGNMWAQQWNLIEPILRPYPDTPSVDVTDEMIKQGYDVERMFRLSEEFFVSIGMEPMVDNFWNDSMIRKPKDRDAVCHASAWDFYNARNFRIKQCTEVDMAWLFVTHHEMGHIVYFQQYRHQPVQYRDGANAGFHEAIGDIMELSVSTPEHLNKIGLLPEFPDNEKLDLNFLMEMALRKVSFLPFGYLIDLWRWSVFDGRTPAKRYNEDWWKLRCSTQGVSPPVTRSDTDFDPGSKYHVANNVPYIRYFISSILQFQIHKELCSAANTTLPLHRCSIYQSQAAGQIMKALLEPGSSKPWPDVLEAAIGTRSMSAKPMLDYFKPLMDFLEADNAKAGERVGWNDKCD